MRRDYKEEEEEKTTAKTGRKKTMKETRDYKKRQRAMKEEETPTKYKYKQTNNKVKSIFESVHSTELTNGNRGRR